MATIITTQPIPATPAADYSIVLHQEPWESSIAELLIRLGQKMIQKEESLEWLRMPQISVLCRRYRLTWQYRTTKAKDLELYLTGYLEKSADIRGSGVKVDYRSEWNKRLRRDELLIRFRKLNPDGTCN